MRLYRHILYARRCQIIAFFTIHNEEVECTNYLDKILKTSFFVNIFDRNERIFSKK